MATCLAEAPTFCAESVYFSVFEGKRFLVMDQSEYLEGAFRKLTEKAVIDEAALQVPLHALDAKFFVLGHLSEDRRNPIGTLEGRLIEIPLDLARNKPLGVVFHGASIYELKNNESLHSKDLRNNVKSTNRNETIM